MTDTTEFDELIQIRRYLHAHPELSRQERETTELVRQRLAAAGLSSVVLPSGTGLYCDVGSGNGPIIALRADLDALPLQDEKNVAYRSTRPGVCHACGHDVHTAILLGAGLELAKRSRELRGRVRLIFQPAEEGVPSGSPDVIAAGGLDGVSLIYALHCDPQLQVGEIGYKFGPITSAYDAVDVVVRGQGGHSARPHLTTDIIYVIGRVVTDLPRTLQQVGQWEPGSGAFITFGAIKSGEARNALPAYAEARGGVRSLNFKAWAELPKVLERAVDNLLKPYDVKWQINHSRVTPIVTNDDVATKLLVVGAARVVGEEPVVPVHQSLGSEDFGWYLQQTPGCLFRLGVRPPTAEGIVDLHSGLFDVDERAIKVGVRTFVETAILALDHSV